MTRVDSPEPSFGECLGRHLEFHLGRNAAGEAETVLVLRPRFHRRSPLLNWQPAYAMQRILAFENWSNPRGE